MKYWIGALTLFLLVAVAGSAQDLLWVRTYDNPGLMDRAYGVATDIDANIVVTGYSEVGDLNYDYHTIKYDQDGNTVWYRRYEGGAIDQAYAVTTDIHGNVIVSGYSDSVYASNPYYYIIKYAPNGDTLWARYGKCGFAYGVTTDWQGNVIVTGLSGAPQAKICGYCTMKYTPEGDTLWTRTHFTVSGGTARGVATDTAGNIVVTGYLERAEYPAYYTIKYSPAGDTIWTRVEEGEGGAYAYAVATDREGNVIVTGDNGRLDFYTIKYDPDGNILWTRDYDGGDDDFAYGVATDAAGNVVVAGASWLGVNYDYYIVKYAANGDTLWTRKYDSGAADLARAVSIDREGNVVVTGSSWGLGDTYYCTVKYSGESDVEEWAHSESMSQDMTVYPNPSNSSVAIQYVLVEDSRVTLRVYDVLGQQIQRVAQKAHNSGTYTITWDATDDTGRKVASGTYFLRLEAHTGLGTGDYSATRKVCVVRP